MTEYTQREHELHAAEQLGLKPHPFKRGDTRVSCECGCRKAHAIHQMPKAPRLKVYAWLGRRREAPGPHLQTREIAAVSSQREAARLAGVRSPSSLRNLSKTGRQDDIRRAMAEPGVLFWRVCSLFLVSLYPSVWNVVAFLGSGSVLSIMVGLAMYGAVKASRPHA